MRTDPLAYLDGELNTLRDQGLFRPLRVLDGEQSAHASIDHRSVVNLSSNNYLGFTTHPRLRERALDALHRSVSAPARCEPSRARCRSTWSWNAASPRSSGVKRQWSSKAAFAANAGTVAALLGRDDVIVSDELNHASIIDGARLSRATIKVFPHRNVAAARAILADLPRGQRTLLITDGVFSMDGDLGALPGLCDIADEFGCIMMVDDAHASGVFGAQGRGTVDHFGLHGRVDVQVGTLSKALGALGGYVAGSRSLIEFLYRRARPFLFSTSHPPSVAATCLAALDVLETEPQWMELLWQNTRFFKAGLQALGFDTGISESPITPVIVGESVAGCQVFRPALRGGSIRTRHYIPDRGA